MMHQEEVSLDFIIKEREKKVPTTDMAEYIEREVTKTNA